jgi:hypothetical protein
MRTGLIGFCKISCTILILLSLFTALLPLTAYMDNEYTVNGSCSINGVGAQGIKLTGPFDAQTESFPGGSYSLFIRLPEGHSSTITITASYEGYEPLSQDIDLNQTNSLNFNLLPPPTIYTVNGICRLNGTLSSGVAVTDETYGSSTFSGPGGAYQLNISVPSGSTARITLVASMSGYDQGSIDLDMNQSTNANFDLSLLPVVTSPPSIGANPSAQATAVSSNQSGSGIGGMISGNMLLISAVLVLLAVVIIGSVLYLKSHAMGKKGKLNEPSREDIYRLVTGDNKRRRRPRNGEGHTGGHRKLK